MSALQVLVIGAGLGGLTLAHSLRRSNIGFQVFERDAGPFDRPQGYRLHLDADGINAAREVLPPGLHDVFVATSQRTTPFTTILATDLSVIKRIPAGDSDGAGPWPFADAAPCHLNVDRATLRQVLLGGVGDAVEYAKVLDRYEQRGDRIIAYFSDGTHAEGDVLVGADGVHSAVRRQRAPHAATADAGVTAIYGRIGLGAAAALAPPEVLEDIFAISSDDRKVFLGLGSVRFPVSPTIAAARLSPGLSMRHQDDYVVCVVGGRHGFFPPDTRDLSGAQLKDIAARMLNSWPGAAGDLIRGGDASAFFSVAMRTSVPCVLDSPTNVTLLGDAIHAMTPSLGRGANVAMRDGALLGRELRKVARGESQLGAALQAFEREMLAYGFAVVREAAHIGAQRMAQNPLPGANLDT